jgi:hypothetical protein
MTSWMLGGLTLLLMAGCASTHPLHLSVPLTTGESLPVVLHAPKAWECSPIAAGKLVCTNITDTPQAATVGNKRYLVPGQTRLHIEEERRDGVWL